MFQNKKYVAKYLTYLSVICSLCRTTDRHQRVNQWSGQSWHPLPGLSHLRHEGSLPGHRWSPCAQRTGGEGPLWQDCTTWIQFQLFFWHLDLKAPVYSKTKLILACWRVLSNCCRTERCEQMSVYSLWFEVCLLNGVHTSWGLWADFAASLSALVMHLFQVKLFLVLAIVFWLNFWHSKLCQYFQNIIFLYLIPCCFFSVYCVSVLRTFCSILISGLSTAGSLRTSTCLKLKRTWC